MRIGTPWFVVDKLTSCIPIQDIIHEGAKLRTRLLKTQLRLLLGNFVESQSDLIELMGKVTKDKHLLKEGDLLLEDKMNYDAVLPLSSGCRPELDDILASYVPSSAGTCFYLKLMYNITTSFLHKNISPLERVYRIWHSVFS